MSALSSVTMPASPVVARQALRWPRSAWSAET